MAAEERLSNIRGWPLSYLQLVIAIAGALAAANDKKGDAARASSSISFPVSVSFDTQSAAMEQRRSQSLFQLPNFSRLERDARRFNELAIAFSLRCSKLLRPPASQTSTPPLASSGQVRRHTSMRRLRIAMATALVLLTAPILPMDE